MRGIALLVRWTESGCEQDWDELMSILWVTNNPQPPIIESSLAGCGESARGIELCYCISANSSGLDYIT